jgi:hypothetical protein
MKMSKSVLVLPLILYVGLAGCASEPTRRGLEGRIAHTDATHTHGARCGHTRITHGDHNDYEHEGHFHALHLDHYDDHGSIAMNNNDRGTASASDDWITHAHSHGVGCGHPAVAHGDHTDYVHDGHFHAPHGDHYHDHGIGSEPEGNREN